MSPIQDSSRMPYELSAEEIEIFVAPLVSPDATKPRSRKWLKRSALVNSELIEFDDLSVVVKGIRAPLVVEAEFRRALPPDIDGMMPKFLGDFTIRDTTFVVTEKANGSSLDDAKLIPVIIENLLKLDSLFRRYWGKKAFPKNVTYTSFSLEPLKRISKRLPEHCALIEKIFDEAMGLPLQGIEQYDRGIIHGDPGIDNVFISNDKIVFIDGPGEVGPELVDVAYLVRSARENFDNFEVEPCIDFLANYFGKAFEEMNFDLYIADIIAQLNVIEWFDRCSTEILPDYEELYDHFIEERLILLDKTICDGNQTL